MIEETFDVHGNLEKGRIYCDNNACNKKMYEWFDKANAPDQNRATFVAHAIKTRFFLSPSLNSLVALALSPSFIFSTDDGHLGYIRDATVLSLQLDFCCKNCSLAWLNDDTIQVLDVNHKRLKGKKYGIMLYYGENSENHQIIADCPTSFTSIAVGNFPPSSAPKIQFKFSNGTQISIAGKEFTIKQSGGIAYGETELTVGVTMTSLTIKCPMDTNTHQTCGQLLRIVLNITPSVWICPKCNGLIIVDKGERKGHHPHSTIQSNKISVDDESVIINYYFGKPSWGNKNFLSWISDSIGASVIAIADAYQDGAVPDMFIMKTLMDANTVVGLFGNLIL